MTGICPPGPPGWGRDEDLVSSCQDKLDVVGSRFRIEFCYMETAIQAPGIIMQEGKRHTRVQDDCLRSPHFADSSGWRWKMAECAQRGSVRTARSQHTVCLSYLPLSQTLSCCYARSLRLCCYPPHALRLLLAYACQSNIPRHLSLDTASCCLWPKGGGIISNSLFCFALWLPAIWVGLRLISDSVHHTK